jgi:hypothetical protein
VLGLTLDVELFSRAHTARASTLRPELSGCGKRLLFHWKEESQHAILDELGWRSEHARRSAAEREQGERPDRAVGAVDGIVRVQAEADAEYFIANAGRALSAAGQASVHDVVLKDIAGSTATGAQERACRVLTGSDAGAIATGRHLRLIIAHAAS